MGLRSTLGPFIRAKVASLAGVSVEYYKRLERGNATGASDQVLDALADALRLDDAERTHLFDLARAASAGRDLVRTESGVRARGDNPRSRGPAPNLSRVQLRSTIDTVTAPRGPPQAFHRFLGGPWHMPTRRS